MMGDYSNEGHLSKFFEKLTVTDHVETKNTVEIIGSVVCSFPIIFPSAVPN